MRLNRKADPKDPKSTATVRDHLEQYYRASGKLPPELEQEQQLPEYGKHLWEVFRSLNLERQSAGHGPLPLTSTQIKDYCNLNRLTLSRLEIEILRAVEVTYLNEIVKEA